MWREDSLGVKVVSQWESSFDDDDEFWACGRLPQLRIGLASGAMVKLSPLVETQGVAGVLTTLIHTSRHVTFLVHLVRLGVLVGGGLRPPAPPGD
jgi:hypothetical protein